MSIRSKSKSYFYSNISSGNNPRPVIPKKQRPILANKAHVPGRAAAARVLNRNLQEVRQKNLLSKREPIRKPPARNVRAIALLRVHCIVSIFTETNPRSSGKDKTCRNESH